MKIIEHRRHSIRHKDTVHLNQKGVELARLIGNSMNSFDRVITSGHERAFETSIAMGYAVDEQLTDLMTFGQEVMDEVDNWSMSFDKIKSYYLKKGPLYQFCLDQEKLLLDEIINISEGGSLLIISHGGVIDYPLVHLFQDEDHKSWGAPFSYCEGYRLFVENNRFVKYELLKENKK